MTQRILSRRTLLGGLTASAGAAILAACGDEAATAITTATAPPATRVAGATTATTGATGATGTTAAPMMTAVATSNPNIIPGGAATSLALSRDATGTAGARASSPAGTSAPAGMPTSAMSGAAPASMMAGTPKPGGTLLMGTLGEAMTINPLISSDAVGANRVKMLFDQFVRLKPDTFEPKPGLAKSWKIEGNTLTFTLADAKFSDGSDVTAEDVAFTMRGILAKATASPQASKFFNIMGAKEYNAGTANDVPGIKAVDAKTLVVTLAAPDAAFLGNLRYVSPVPKKLLDGKDLSGASKDPFFQKPVGAGPYVLQSWQVGGDFVMTKNPNYYQPGKPYLDKVTDRVIPDAQSLVNALLSGDIEASVYPSPAGATMLKAKPDLNVIVPPFAAPEGWHFNFKNAYLAKKEVRQAIAMALDVPQFAKDSLYGLGQEASGPVAPGNFVFDKSLKPIKYNLDMARALVKQAGTPPASIEFITNKGNVLREDWLTLTQAQLDKIGIKVNAQAIEFATLIDRRRKKDFEAVCINGGALVSGNELVDAFSTTGSSNYTGYSNPMLDLLLSQANQITDPEKQKPLYAQAQAILLDELPFFGAWYRPYLHVAKKKFAGYTSSADTGGIFYEIENWYVNG